MNLQAHIASFPRHLRGKVRLALAEAAGVTEAAVRHWANGTRNMHPNKVLAVEKATQGQVTRYELRPDVFGAAP